MAMFYQAERKALAKHVLLKSFADVGLKPFDPAKIFANCAEQTPSQPSVYYTEATNELISAIKEQTRKRVCVQDQLLSSLKPDTLSPMKKSETTECGRQNEAEESEEENEDQPASEISQNTDVTEQLPQKRRRMSRRTPIACAVSGCKNTHFWSTTWLTCPKCKRQFCPKHLEHVHLHACP